MAIISSFFWRIFLIIVSLLPHCLHCSMWKNKSAMQQYETPKPTNLQYPSTSLPTNNYKLSTTDQNYQSNLESGDNVADFRPFKIPIFAPLHDNVGHYVKLGLGNPKQEVVLYVSSSSSVSWVNCFSQANTNIRHFDHRSSDSFNFIECPSQPCSEMNYSGNTACHRSICAYRALYEGRHLLEGGFGFDLLTLTSDHQLQNFLFGCNMKTTNSKLRGAGLLGLGLNRGSFVQQLAKKYGSIFSYCLPSSRSHLGYLKIGNDVSSSVKYTSFLEFKGTYGLELIAIKVDDTKLAIDPRILSQKSAIIDSGTTLSRLPRTAYNALRKEFDKKMSNYPKIETSSILETCYDMRGKISVEYPSIGLIFRDGVEVSIDQSGAMLKEDLSHVCLAFLGHDEDGREPIIGRMAQKTWEVVYDIKREKIGIGHKGCL